MYVCVFLFVCSIQCKFCQNNMHKHALPMKYPYTCNKFFMKFHFLKIVKKNDFHQDDCIFTCLFLVSKYARDMHLNTMCGKRNTKI